jgi:crotonobetainyl-CoA:carnitine CoA-transferase CaiB-like acyl-CoA transferase
MAEEENVEGMLSPYRVLDLTDEKGLLCGKLLGDLGADVIKIERLGGDPARNIGPFYHDEVDPEKSLFWWAFNTSKRGITLDIEAADGREVFKKLVEGADFVIESFPPGYMEKYGLGYSALDRINPGVIMVSITPFGQTGPYKDYKASDIVAWAMGGVMYVTGDADRPPVRVSHHSQAYVRAGVEAAVGAMMALCYREMRGEGQHVDVSIQDCVAQSVDAVTATWDMTKVNVRRGAMPPGINARLRMTWPCKDGYLVWMYRFGYWAHVSRSLVNWMDSEGMADNFLKGFDWATVDQATIPQEAADRINEPTRKFFMAHTKAEFLEGASKRRIMLYPVSTTADMLESVQLAARGLWVNVDHPEFGTSIIYPGAFAYSSEASPRISRRAPLIGENNQEIFGKELGLSKEGLPILRQGKGYPAKPNRKIERESGEEKLLAGVKVADFSWALVGPLTTQIFSDYGAEVIKIEGRSRPDPRRFSGLFKDGIPGLDRSGYFNPYNTSKLGIALNLAHPKGVDVAKRLVAWADIVVENFAGGAMKRMGLGYEELRKVKPDIIMLSSCAMGQTGPHAMDASIGFQLTALSGFNYITGWPDREPASLDAYTDYISPRFNVLAILAALDYRHRTGKGQYLDLSQYENGIHFMAPLILDYVVNQRIANRMGNRSPYAAPHGAYRCLGEDRWCAIAVFTDEEWQSFCKVIGKPAWTSDARFTTLLARKENEEELDRLIEGWTIDHSPEEVMSIMQAAGVGAGVLQTGEDLLEHDPQLRHRHFFWEFDHPETGKYRASGPCFVLSKSACELRRAPLLGEHNEYVLKEILRMSDEEIAELVVEGVIE